jgi:CRP/FNR family transcriptional regulator, cyclic AMP receptor protein
MNRNEGLARTIEPTAMQTPSHAEKRKLLEGHFLFGRLNAAELDSLLTYTRVEHFAARQEIFAKGSPGDRMMAVMRGRVKISSLSSEGREIVLNIISEGEIFGEIALIDGKDRTADAVAMTECDLLVLHRRDFLPFLERHADVCLILLGLLCERLRRTSEQLEDISFRHLQSRLAKVLLRLARSGAPDDQGELRIDLGLSQRELGTIVGGTRESINKHLQALHRSGTIELEKGAILIRDVAALERIA